MTQNNKTDVVTNTKCLVHQTKSFWCCNSIYFGIIGSERAKRSHIQWMGSPDSKGEWRQVPPPTTGPSHKLLARHTGRMLSSRWDSGGLFHFPLRKDSKISQDQVQSPSHPWTLLNHSFIHSAPTACQAPTVFSVVSMRWIWQSPVLRSPQADGYFLGGVRGCS